MKLGAVPVDEAEGAILAHGMLTGAGRLAKGTVLTAAHVTALKQAGLVHVIAARLNAGDVPEDAAAARLAAELAGPSLRIDAAAAGRVNIFAEQAGVFRVRAPLIHRLNAIDPAVTLATLPDFAAVKAGAMLATVKIIPFAVPGDILGRVLELPLRGALALHAFCPKSVVLIQTELPSLKASVLAKTEAVTADRIASFGGDMRIAGRVPHHAEALSAMLRAARADIVLVFGASAVTGDQDVIPEAIRLAGGTVERVGMPVDPGNLLVLGRMGGRIVLGAPGCARSPKENGFDWVLARLFAGLRVTSRDIARMGVGGLLMEIPTRPRPRLGDHAENIIDD
ncbi:MAG: molybdopterin-binding protein [Rhizobiaceae bacterium]|nr:molybdopterin-binding protein [Rhizobiaceae bacterium]